MQDKGLGRRDFMRGTVAGGAGLGLLGGARMAGAQEADPAGPAGTVPRRTLGKTGETIPILFMGGSQTFDAKYDKMLHRAYQMGINYIDTAQVYAAGQSHKTIAPFLQQVGRKNMWVTSKVKLSSRTASAENYKKYLEKCLEDLETDYLDMFFMHMIDHERFLDADILAIGDELKKAGKIRYFGFSCHHGNVPEMMSLAATPERAGAIDAIMFRYNFRQYGDEKLNRAMDACREQDIGLLAMKTQGSVPDDQEKVVEFQSKDFTLPQAKLKSVWADERITGCVSQITNLDILAENAGAAMSPVELTMNEFHQLNRLARMTKSFACLGCNSICESRIDGQLRIADALRYLMYAECYDDPETARMLYHALLPVERDFEHVDFAEAKDACPQDIQIDARLRRAKELLMA